jgi:hypothetical protein
MAVRDSFKRPSGIWGWALLAMRVLIDVVDCFSRKDYIANKYRATFPAGVRFPPVVWSMIDLVRGPYGQWILIITGLLLIAWGSRKTDGAVLRGEDDVTEAAHGLFPIGRIHLKWHPTDYGLDVDATNMTERTIREFRLVLTDLRFHIGGASFVEVQELYANGPFLEMELVGSSTLFPAHPERFRFLDGSASEALLLRGETKDSPVDARVIRKEGIWLAIFRLEIADRQCPGELMFQWTPGKLPEPYQFPRSVMPPPPPP